MGLAILGLALVLWWIFKKLWYELGMDDIARKRIKKKFDSEE